MGFITRGFMMIGILAAIVLVAGCLLSAGALYASYKSDGEGSMGYGFLALIIFIISASMAFNLMDHFCR